MTIQAAGKLQFVVHFAESSKRKILIGQQVLLTAADQINQHVKVEVVSVEAETEAEPGNLAVTFEIAQAPDYFRQDMMLTAEFEVALRSDALFVSTEAIRNLDGTEPWVLLVENGRVKRQILKLGQREKDRVVVLEGLGEGDLVLPATTQDIEEGKRIRLAIAR